MKKVVLVVTLMLGLRLFTPLPAGAVAKEIIQLQRDVALLQQQLRDLQRSVDEKTAVLKTLVEQALDAVNRMNLTVNNLERAVRETQAGAEARVDSLGTQVAALRDSLDELRVRVAKLSEQMIEAQGVLRGVDARLASPPPPAEQASESPAAPAAPAIPSADTLYDTALRDFTTGKYDLARQQFSDYLKHYGETQLAGNAQFYIGETYYQQKNYQQAIAEYDKVLTKYPKSYKLAAAQLKKGYALLELNDRTGGIRALRTVIRDYPNSEEARLARARLQRLGVPNSGAD